MLCQSCKTRQANTHIKSMVNGEVSEMRLCSECAAKLGYGNAFEHFDIGSLMSGFMGDSIPSALAPEKHCPRCGLTFAAISKSGRVGCAKCYDTFYDRLLPSIKRIHGNTIHTGKRLRKPQLQSGESISQDNTQVKVSEVDKLTSELQSAISNQEFEKAALLRDKINELKADRGGNE